MQNQINNSDAEISLSQVADKVKGYINSVNNAIFDAIQFVIRNIIIIIALIVIGVGLGTYLDMGDKIYTHKIIVMPNFKSVNYLYQEVERINSKIKDNDFEYLEKMGIPKPKRVVKVEIEAIVDIYEFIEDNGGAPENDSKFQLFKLISENGDMNKMLEDNTTSKYYKNHVITITTRGRATQENTIKPFLKHLDSNVYFKQLQKVFFKNLESVTKSNDSIIRQIDAVIKDFSTSSQKSSNNLVFLNEKTELNQLIEIKQKLIDRNLYSNVQKVDYSKVIKDNSILLNIRASGLGMKVILPLFLLIAFVIIFTFRKYYKKQVNKRKTAAINA